jgi:hypothetical protein
MSLDGIPVAQARCGSRTPEASGSDHVQTSEVGDVLSILNDVETLERVTPKDGTAGESWRHRTTSEMINDCFRHQHPEAYGGDPVPQAAVPWDLQCGRDHLVASPASTLPEEAMGNPGAHQIDP